MTDPTDAIEYSPGGYDEQYSPAPTGASAEYYPQTNAFPPPPNPGYEAPAYNPQDYPAPPHVQAPQIPGQAADPYGYAPPRPNDPYAAPGTGPRGEERTADNVSPLTTDDEGACCSSASSLPSISTGSRSR